MAVGSIVDYLSSSGRDSSYAARRKLAEEYGISGYSGTASQNTKLLGMLQNGSATNNAAKIQGLANAAQCNCGGSHGKRFDRGEVDVPEV